MAKHSGGNWLTPGILASGNPNPIRYMTMMAGIARNRSMYAIASIRIVTPARPGAIRATASRSPKVSTMISETTARVFTLNAAAMS